MGDGALIVPAVYLQPEVQSPGSNMNTMELLSKTNNNGHTILSFTKNTTIDLWPRHLFACTLNLHHDGECKVEHAYLLP